MKFSSCHATMPECVAYNQHHQSSTLSAAAVAAV
jgi:hypothetical protein